MPQSNLLYFKPVVPLFSIYYSFLNIRPPKLVTKRLSDTMIVPISALTSAPSRPPNPTLTPQNQASSKNPRSKVQKTQKTGCAFSEQYTK